MSHRARALLSRAESLASICLARLLSLLAPPLCWGCRSAAPAGEALCRVCRAELSWLGPDAVDLLGVEAWAAVGYDGPARALVHGLKFRGARGLAATMSAQMAANAPSGLLRGCALVPVPSTTRRARRRGFNQAALLAHALGERSGRPVADCLVRRGRALPQVGRPRGERLRAVTGSVALRPGARGPEKALLVDDVITTGATLAACALVLRQAGSASVSAVAYARTPGR